MVEAAIIAATTTVLIAIAALVFIWRLCSMADKSGRIVHISFKRLIAVEVRYGEINTVPATDEAQGVLSDEDVPPGRTVDEMSSWGPFSPAAVRLSSNPGNESSE